MSHKYYEITILFVCIVNSILADTACGDWQTYKDEKCVMLFDTLLSYEEAVSKCADLKSTLITIQSVEEQQFVENYLYTNHKVIENVWTGLKYADSKYKWLNDLDANYTNWSVGSPKNTSGFCTEINSDASLLGKWTDIACSKRNLAFCQKMPEFSTQQLLALIINNRNNFENTVLRQNSVNIEQEMKIQQLGNKLENSSKQLLATSIKLADTADLLSNTNNRLEKTNKLFDYFFSNKWIHFKTFEENSKRKALIFPHKCELRVTRPQAVKLCAQNNATLVDIESEEKQKLVEAFLYQINPKLSFNFYFIGGYYESSTGKHKWLTSGHEFVYTNWASNNNPLNWPFVVIHSTYDELNDGKWYTVDITSAFTENVFCEIEFLF